jgi:hypothetical protein
MILLVSQLTSKFIMLLLERRTEYRKNCTLLVCRTPATVATVASTAPQLRRGDSWKQNVRWSPGRARARAKVAARVDRRASSETALSSSRDEQSAHSTPRGLTAGAILLCLLACEHKVVTVRYTYVVGGSGT